MRFRQAVVINRSLAEGMLREWPDLLEERIGSGETALHWWAIEGNDVAVQWLLSLGAKVDTKDESGATPLIHAAQLGNVTTCKILLSAERVEKSLTRKHSPRSRPESESEV